jgi:hypothetical protein
MCGMRGGLVRGQIILSCIWSVRMTEETNDLVIENVEDAKNKLTALPPGERYELLQKIAVEGYVVTIRLYLDTEGVLRENIKVRTVDEFLHGE